MWANLGKIGISMMAAAICLLAPLSPASAQSIDEIKARITAEYAQQLATADALRTRDLELADDEKRRAEEEATRTAEGLRQRILTLQIRLQSARASRKIQSKEIVALHVQLTAASSAYTEALEKRDAETRAMIEAFKASINRSVEQATPDELAAMQRVIDGDDDAFQTLNQIVDAKIAANNSAAAIANVAAKTRVARIDELRYYQKKTTRQGVVATWQQVIALDPTEIEPRIALCKFILLNLTDGDFGVDITASVDNLKAAQHNALLQCRQLAAPFGPRDQLEVFSVMSGTQTLIETDEADLSVDLDGLALIDNLIHRREVDEKMMMLVVNFTKSAFNKNNQIKFNNIRFDQRNINGHKRLTSSEIRHIARHESVSLLEIGFGRLKNLASLLGQSDGLEYLEYIYKIATLEIYSDPQLAARRLSHLEETIIQHLAVDPLSRELHAFRGDVLNQLRELRSRTLEARRDPSQAALIKQVVEERTWVVAHANPSEHEALQNDREALADALAGLEEIAPDDSPEQLVAFHNELDVRLDIVAADRGKFRNDEDAEDVARILFVIGHINSELGIPSEAVKFFDFASQIYLQLAARHRDDSSFSSLAASSLEGKSKVLERQGDFAGSIAALVQANQAIAHWDAADLTGETHDNDVKIARLRQRVADGAPK